MATIRIKRRVSGAAGAPSGLKNAELAFNEVDSTLYYGKGDDGNGNATSIEAIAGAGQFVDKTSAQTVGGVKTFTSSPVVPTPTGDFQAATKKYVDDAMAAAGQVSSVNGFTGAVVLETDDIAEGATNLYYTDARAKAAAVGDAIVDGETQVAPSQNAVFDALALKQSLADKGQANGYAPLGSDSKIPSAYLPSYVDDVLEYANLAAFPVTGEAGKIYVALDTGKTYRWSGSTYTQIATGDVASVFGRTGVITAQAGDYNTDLVTEGSTNLYHTAGRVLATALAGLSTATAAVITSADTILSALGKLQAQVTARLVASNNLSDLTDAAAARSNLGLGTIATQNANNVSITGGSITGATIDAGSF